MESPKLRAKRFEYELLSTDNTEQTIILENPHHKFDETTSDRRQRRRSKYMNQVIFKKKISQVTKVLFQNRQVRSQSSASYISYTNNKRRTSTILVKPISHSKSSHHQKEKQTFILTDNESRLIPIDSHHRDHQIEIETMRREITQALAHIRYIAAHCAHETLIESVRDEWKFIATVIDRLQFIIFSTVTAIGSIALLFQV